MKDVLLGIGQKLKSIRKSNSLTLSDVAARAQVSTALVSKVENGRTIPSLPVLLSLLKSLGEDPSNFFRGITLQRDKPYFVIRNNEYTPIEKEDAHGYNYQLVMDKWLFSVGFQIVFLTVEPGAKRDKTQTDAFEFKYMLSGTCTYIIGEDTIELNEGDALYFDGRIPHNPENHKDEAARMLVIYFYLEQEEK
ncbi:MAG: XRE family transcriptional regulator [Bacteroidia bacterium]|nr:XRE family transcriptional regulator [Bacteroidia bacterium]